MKIIWFCLSFLSLSLAVVGQPVQVSANDLLVEAALIDGAKENFLRNTDKAVAIYQKLLKDYPSNDLADYYLALIYQDSAQWEKAISYALAATKKSPENLWFQQKLASLYMQNSQFNLAIPVLQKCITLDPKEVDFYQSLIVCHQKASDWNAAFKVLDLLEAAWGISPKVIIQRQQLFHLSGNIPKAKKELNSLISLFPSDENHFYLATDYFIKNKDPEGASKILKQLLFLQPDATRAKFELSQLENNSTTTSLLSLNSFFSDNQIDTEKKRGRLMPELAKLVVSKEVSLKEQLLVLCASMEAAHPSDAVPLALQAEIYRIMGVVDTAMLKYKAALKKDESVFFVWENYLHLLWTTGQSVSLTKEALFAWDIFPNNPKIPFYAAYGYLFQGKITEALPLMEEAFLQSSKDEQLTNHLMALKALSLSLQGEKVAANDIFLSLKGKDIKSYLWALQILSGGEMPLPLTNTGQDDMYNEALVMHAKAFAAFKANQLNAALKLFAEGAKWGTPLFFEHWGDVFLSANNTLEAENAYKKSLELGNTGKSLSLKLSKF
jgi:tetratricopeptide (TPR) repeat protein